MKVACSMHGKMINEYIILVGKPEEKRPLLRPTSRWEGIMLELIL
jgi:hypothetical protein